MVVTLHLSIIFHPTNSLWACAHSVSSKSCLSISLRKPVQRPTHPTSIIGIMPVLHVWKHLWFQVWWNRHGQRAFARKLRKLLCLFKDFIEMGNKLQSATLCPLGKTGFLWILYGLRTHYLSLWETQPRRSCASEASRDQRSSSEKPERLTDVHAKAYIYIILYI
jgi:hypothetical protein